MIRHIAVICLLLVSGLSSMRAEACQFSWDETWKIWRADCPLGFDPKGPVKRVEVITGRLHLKFPDLVIDKLKFYLRGSQIEIYADIQNIGTGSSPAVPVVLNVTTFDPLNPMNTSVRPLGPVMTPALASNATQRVLLGTITVDHSMHDVDVLSTGSVDPIGSGPPYGSVLEELESNNDVMHHCRVYGPNPNVARQACN